MSLLKNTEFNKIMEIIVNALRERGYNPYMQLYGYVTENEPSYITKHNNARELITTLDKEKVQIYVQNMKQS
ncbi:MAG: IreB family regulatory phosphoprotein [Acutalibacteraceae bacterium]|nr:IreB family regulatory phosphoprotein [Acutalibacteraceae bacterium]